MTEKYVYKANTITVLSGIEAVRKRPGMYLGSVDAKGIQVLIDDVLALSVLRQLNGKSKATIIEIVSDTSFSIKDQDTQLSEEELHHLLHDHKDHLTNESLIVTSIYNFSYYLITNALSSSFSITRNDGAVAKTFLFQKGEQVKEEITDCQELSIVTKVELDSEVFGNAGIHTERLLYRLKELKAFFPLLQFTLIDQKRKSHFSTVNSIADLVDFSAVITPIITAKLSLDDYDIELAFAFQNNEQLQLKNYVNTLPVLGGTHVEGFRVGIVTAIREQLKKEGIHFRKRKVDLGIVGVMACLVRHPHFAGATREFIENKPMKSLMKDLTFHALNNFFYHHSAEKEQIVTLYR